MIELIYRIAKSKNDVVFVGSVSLWYLKLINDPHDIDIVVNTLDGLEQFGKIDTWETKSSISPSGKRACIKRKDYNIDIFIEPILPDYNVIDGVKIQTIEYFKKFIDRCVNISDGQRKNIFLQKKKLIQHVT